MQRGIVKLSSSELRELINTINWKYLPDLLSERLRNAHIPDQTDDIPVFLSAEDTEEILDALDTTQLFSTDTGKTAYTKLQTFLQSLRQQ